MIFITVGSQKFQFNRLLEAVDKLVEKQIITDEVFAQIGYSNYIPQNYAFKPFLNRDEFAELTSRANIVITHGGTGAIIGAVKKGKKVIAVPRLSAFGEHINDHQIQIVDSFDKQDFLIGVTELDDLEEALNKAKTFKPKHFKSETDHMIKIIEDFIDNN